MRTRWAAVDTGTDLRLRVVTSKGAVHRSDRGDHRCGQYLVTIPVRSSTPTWGFPLLLVTEREMRAPLRAGGSAASLSRRVSSIGRSELLSSLHERNSEASHGVLGLDRRLNVTRSHQDGFDARVRRLLKSLPAGHQTGSGQVVPGQRVSSQAGPAIPPARSINFSSLA